MNLITFTRLCAVQFNETIEEASDRIRTDFEEAGFWAYGDDEERQGNIALASTGSNDRIIFGYQNFKEDGSGRVSFEDDNGEYLAKIEYRKDGHAILFVKGDILGARYDNGGDATLSLVEELLK